MVEDSSGIVPRQPMEGSFPVLRPKNLDVPTLCLQLKKMKEKKGLYPDKSIYTQQIGPGLCFGALALMLRFFFEVPGLWGRGTSLLGLAGRIAGCLHVEAPSCRFCAVEDGTCHPQCSSIIACVDKSGPADFRMHACAEVTRSWFPAPADREQRRAASLSAVFSGWDGWQRHQMAEFREGVEALTDSFSSTGMGLHLRSQLLPLCPGHVLRSAAAQGQQEGWERRGPRQADLLHSLLHLCLTVAPLLQAPAFLSGSPAVSPGILPTLSQWNVHEEWPPLHPERPPGLLQSAKCCLGTHEFCVHQLFHSIQEKKKRELYPPRLHNHRCAWQSSRPINIGPKSQPSSIHNSSIRVIYFPACQDCLPSLGNWDCPFYPRPGPEISPFRELDPVSPAPVWTQAWCPCLSPIPSAHFSVEPFTVNSRSVTSR